MSLKSFFPPPSIQGLVTEKLTGNTIFGAKITFGSKYVFTGIDGWYIMENPDLISGPITCEAEGFKTETEFITAPEGGVLVVDFMLEPIGPPPQYVNTSATITNVGTIDAPVGILSEFIKADTGESYGLTGESRIIFVGEAYQGSYTIDYSYFPSGAYNAKLIVFDASTGKELDSEIKLLAIVK